MNDKVPKWSRLAPAMLLAAVALFLNSCSLIGGSRGRATPVVKPFPGAPVTVTVDGATLIVANNTSDPIYHLVFATEVLEAIEWAPCIAPEVCPDEQKIEAGEEKRTRLRTIVRDDTESITVFWWRFLEKLEGASIPPMEMEEIVVTLP